MKQLFLSRLDKVVTGIFGNLQSDDRAFYCKTLEHAYAVPDSDPAIFAAKILPGTYTCVRGIHTIGHEKPVKIETFEVTGVFGHQGILFHPGNVNADSEGCILLGERQDGDVDIAQSRDAFKDFMNHLTGLDSFELVVGE